MPVTGVVLDALTGAPVPGALVSTFPPDDRRSARTVARRLPVPRGAQPQGTTAKLDDTAAKPEEQQLTDAQGRFRFPFMSWNGGVSLYVTGPGYLEANSEGARTARFAIAVGPGMGELRLPLNPGSGIHGQVISSDGLLLSQMRLTLYRVKYTAEKPVWTPWAFQQTSTDGRYRFEHLPAGTYFVVSQWLVDHQPPASTDGTCTEFQFTSEGGFVPEAAPGVLDFRQASPIRLREGEDAAADLRLQHQRFHAVTVQYPANQNRGFLQITDVNGRSLDLPDNPYISCRQVIRHVSDSEQIYLPDGTYLFRQSGAFLNDDPSEMAKTKQPVMLQGYAPVRVAGKPVTVTIPVIPEDQLPTLEVRSHLSSRVPAGLPGEDFCSPTPRGVLGGTSSLNTAASPNLRIGLIPRDSFGGERPTIKEKRKGPGLDEVSGIRPGSSWVIPLGPDHGYVASMTANGVDLLQHPLVAGIDGRSTYVDVVVGDDCGRVHFEKPWAKPVPDSATADAVGIVNPFFELLVPQFCGAAGSAECTLTQTMFERGIPASFTLGDLAPGHYKAFESSDQYAAEYFSLGELQQRLGPGKDIWLKPREKVTLDVHDPPR